MFERGSILLSDARLLVIDEADRMLDMGFIPDVERIVGLLPQNRQTLFFCATLAPEIRRLADAFLRNPKEITVTRAASVAPPRSPRRWRWCRRHDKREALRRLIRLGGRAERADLLQPQARRGHPVQVADSAHGSASARCTATCRSRLRFATLEKFKAGETRLLCCSDVAARGLDIGGLSHVFNFDVPHHPEDYVHRIGRTGRAGREGRAFTLATPEDQRGGGGDREADPPPDPAHRDRGARPGGVGRGGWAPAAVAGRRPAAKPRAAKPAAIAAQPHRRLPAQPLPTAASSRSRAPPLPASARRRSRLPGGPRAQRGGSAARHVGARHVGARRYRERAASERTASGREPRERDAPERETVVGFGGDVPAFMLVPARPAWRRGPLAKTEAGARHMSRRRGIAKRNARRRSTGTTRCCSTTS